MPNIQKYNLPGHQVARLTGNAFDAKTHTQAKSKSRDEPPTPLLYAVATLALSDKKKHYLRENMLLASDVKRSEPFVAVLQSA